MADEVQKPKKSLAEVLLLADLWLKAQTPKWTADLENLSILVERPIDNEELTLATHYLGAIYRSAATQGQAWRTEAFFKEYSVPIARVIAGIGYRKYEKGNFWDGFWDAISLAQRFDGDRFAGKSKAEISAEWGSCFLGVLNKFNLPTFPGHTQKYVVPILIHSGIPISCLPNFFLAIDRGLNEVGFNAEAIVHYLVGDESNHAYGINKPVLRFLEAGGEFAIEFVDRSIEALGKLSRGESLDSHPLPEDVLSAAKTYFDQQSDWGQETRKGRKLRAGKVEIQLNVAFGEINLLLPEVETYESDFTWDLGFDELFIQEKPRTIPGGYFTRRQNLIKTLDRPIRRLSVQASDGGVSREIGLYDSDFPAVIFTIDGELVPRNVTLPKGITYVLMAKEKAKGFDVNADFVQQEISPLGWHDWELFRFDLSDLNNLAIFQDGPSKQIANKVKATIKTSSIIEGLTFNGMPVSVDRPKVVIPPGINSVWQIEIRDLENHEASTFLEVNGSGIELEVDVFEEQLGTVFGAYEVSVRGPLGLGAAQRFVIVENLRVERPNDWRHLGNEGLSVHIAEFFSNDIQINPKIAYLDSSTVLSSVKFSTAEKNLECTYYPPSMSIALRASGIPQAWQYGPLNINADELENAELMIKVPSRYADLQLSLVTKGESHQSVSNSLRQNKQILSFQLVNFSAVLKRLTEGDLFFDFQGLNLRVGRIRPKEVATSVDATNYDIYLNDFTGGDVVMRIWSINEPWRPFIDTKVPENGIVPLPPEFVGLGSLCVQWERVDPWSPTTLTDLPEKNKYKFVSLISNPLNISLLGKQIETGNLLGKERFAKLNHCWTALLLSLRVNNSSQLNPKVVRNAAGLIEKDPIHALEVLSMRNLPQNETWLAIIESGILSAPVNRGSKSKLSDGELTSLFKRSNFAMLLPVINTAMHQNSPKHLPELWRQIILTFGEEFRSTAISGDLASPMAGGFAKMENVLGQNPSNADYFVNLTGAYPRESLHVDTRMIAGLNLFKCREVFTEHTSGLQLERVLLDIQHEFTVKMPYANPSISSRTSPDNKGWQVLSAVSLALAFLNRGTAHGLLLSAPKCKKYEELTSLFAIHASDLFLADLALVEITILAQDPSRRPFFTNDLPDGELNELEH